MARVTPGQAGCDVLEVVPLAGGTFSAQLIPQIAALLEKHNFTKRDIAGFAAASGPGSFTGLRVGLAAIKGLAAGLQKPIAAVSLLEAVARTSSGRGRVLAALDAGRGEVYCGDYDVAPQVRMRGERLLSSDRFLDEARASQADDFHRPEEICAVVTPDPRLADLVRQALLTVEQITAPQSDAIARLGWERILRGETVTPEDLEANYIRRSDAEILSGPKV